MSNRIVTQGCTKCGGAIKEEAEVGEWSCMNCGMLFLPEKSTKVRETSRPPTFKEDVEEEPEGKSTLDSLSEVPILELEDLGDDLEWERLNPHLKPASKEKEGKKLVTSQTPKEIGRHTFSVCKDCGKKGSYTYGTDPSTECCKYCNPRDPWKGI